jgi:hypothetical protein
MGENIKEACLGYVTFELVSQTVRSLTGEEGRKGGCVVGFR